MTKKEVKEKSNELYAEAKASRVEYERCVLKNKQGICPEQELRKAKKDYARKIKGARKYYMDNFDLLEA